MELGGLPPLAPRMRPCAVRKRTCAVLARGCAARARGCAARARAWAALAEKNAIPASAGLGLQERRVDAAQDRMERMLQLDAVFRDQRCNRVHDVADGIML